MLVTAARGGLGPGLECRPVGDPVQPTRQGVVLANGTQLLSEHQEGGLTRVLGVLGILQDAPADAVNHRPVPAQQSLEGRRLAPGKELLDELPVGLVRQRFRGHSPRESPKEDTQANRSHSPPSQPCPCSPQSSAPSGTEVPNFLDSDLGPDLPGRSQREGRLRDRLVDFQSPSWAQVS